MSAIRSQRRPALESLEGRLVLSAAANTLATVQGVVARPREVSQVVSTIQEANLARPKHSTILALYARPEPGSTLDPRIVSTQGPNGARLPIRHGAPFRAGLHPADAFTKVKQPGSLTTGVTGRDDSTGAYGLSTTLPGDLNGDGKVDLSDMQAFAPAYLTHLGDGFYNPAADANRNGFIGQGDAKLMVRNLAPITPRIPLNVQLALAPGQYVRGTNFMTSGGVTNHKDITIVGKTTPGSAIFADSGLGDYSFTGPFLTTDAHGNFSLAAKNKEGLNNYEFLVIDPFGHQKIRDFPVFWIPFAQGKVN
jgi:hypothetical protein